MDHRGDARDRRRSAPAILVAPPLILTLRLDAATMARFERERRAHFPPERNLVPAHVTLVHHLPGEEEDAVRGVVRDVVRRAPFPVAVSGLRSLGRGVAYVLDSPELAAVHATLAAAFAPWLTAQDRQPFRPHVVVQNKAGLDAARALRAELEATFVPFTATASAIDVWRYLGGPWEPLAQFGFGDTLPPRSPHEPGEDRLQR